MTAPKKPSTKPKAPAKPKAAPKAAELTVDEAAALLNMAPDALAWSRYKGVAPGNLGRRLEVGGPLLWNREELEAHKPKA